jgi:hypothetical protein
LLTDQLDDATLEAALDFSRVRDQATPLIDRVLATHERLRQQEETGH